MLRTNHLRRRGKQFYFRMRMPKLLTRATNRRYIEKSLGMVDFTTARLMAQQIRDKVTE